MMINGSGPPAAKIVQPYFDVRPGLVICDAHSISEYANAASGVGSQEDGFVETEAHLHILLGIYHVYRNQRGRINHSQS